MFQYESYMFPCDVEKVVAIMFYGEKFRNLRKNRGISVDRLTKKAGITRVTLWRWESGKSNPSELQIRMLSKTIEVPVSEFSELEDEKPISTGNFSEIVNSWLLLADISEKEIDTQEDLLIKLIHQKNLELKQATVIIKALTRSIQSQFYVKDVNQKYITANEAFLKNLSLSNNFSVLGKRDDDFFTKTEAKLNTEQDLDVLMHGNPITKKEQYILGSRKKKWGIISKIPIFDSKGNIAGVVGSALDITEKKIIENRRSILEELLNSVEDIVVVHNLEKNKVSFVNKAFMKITRYELNVLYDDIDFWKSIVVKEDIEEFRKILKCETWSERLNFRIITKNNELRWLNTTSHSHKVINGNDFHIWILRDITEIKKSDEQKEILYELLDSSDDVVGVYDITNEKDIYISKSIETLTGYKAEEFYENPDIWYDKCINAEHREKRKQYSKDKNWPEYSEVKITNKSGEIYWCNIRVHKKQIFGRTCHIWIARNITAEKKKEEYREILNKLFAHSNDVIAVLDIDEGKYIFITESIEQLTGYSSDNFYKDAAFWHKKCLPESERVVREKYFREKSWPSKSKIRMLRKDGKTRWCEAIINREKILNKNCIVMVARDITEKQNNCSNN